MPESVDEFYHLLKTFFPTVYDIKYLIKDLKNLKDSGLSKLAAELRVIYILILRKLNRIGPQHQAGSDSLATLAVYFKLKESQLKNNP